MCEDYDVPDGDRIYLLKFALKGDASELLESINGRKYRLGQVVVAFAGRYESSTNRDEISARLSKLILEYCRQSDQD